MSRKKNNKKCRDYWDGVPEALRQMCLAAGYDDSGCSAMAICHYLTETANNCDHYFFDNTPYDIIKWTVKAIDYCFFPISINEKNWKECLDEFGAVIGQTRELMNKYGPGDVENGHICSDYDTRKYDMVRFSQRLDLYFSVYYMLRQEYMKAGEALKVLLDDTERNVKYMFGLEYAYDYASADDWADDEFDYLPEVDLDVWEPINMLARGSFPDDESEKLFARVYLMYIRFLEQYNMVHVKHFDSCAGMHLQYNAEFRLRDLCSLIIEGIDDTISMDPDMPDDEKQTLLEEKKEFEAMLEASYNRENALGAMYEADKSGDASEEGTVTEDDPDAEEGAEESGPDEGPTKENRALSKAVKRIAAKPDYHIHYRIFTRDLFRMMQKNPSLPVVFLPAKSADLECNIAYAQGKDWAEKFICVSIKKPDEDDIEVPF